MEPGARRTEWGLVVWPLCRPLGTHSLALFSVVRPYLLHRKICGNDKIQSQSWYLTHSKCSLNGHFLIFGFDEV